MMGEQLRQDHQHQRDAGEVVQPALVEFRQEVPQILRFRFGHPPAWHPDRVHGSPSGSLTHVDAPIRVNAAGQSTRVRYGFAKDVT